MCSVGVTVADVNITEWRGRWNGDVLGVRWWSGMCVRWKEVLCKGVGGGGGT